MINNKRKNQCLQICVWPLVTYYFPMSKLSKPPHLQPVGPVASAATY